ncbi:unnamed protein product [Camellia sinensis]
MVHFSTLIHIRISFFVPVGLHFYFFFSFLFFLDSAFSPTFQAIVCNLYVSVFSFFGSLENFLESNSLVLEAEVVSTIFETKLRIVELLDR